MLAFGHVPSPEFVVILSVDLASRRYADIGIALLSREGSSNVHVELVYAECDLRLAGVPNAQTLADALLTLATDRGVRLILIDGPQGWRADGSPLLHARACERETHTPGKTGLPGVVKPQTWTNFALFSVALFDALHEAGWPRLGVSWAGAPAAIESFPTHAWRCLGQPSLPGKSKRPVLAPWRDALAGFGVSPIPDDVSHDQLQAIVAGLAGVQMLEQGLGACDVRGLPPAFERGSWREGYIVSPRAFMPA